MFPYEDQPQECVGLVKATRLNRLRKAVSANRVGSLFVLVRQ